VLVVDRVGLVTVLALVDMAGRYHTKIALRFLLVKIAPSWSAIGQPVLQALPPLVAIHLLHCQT
jgi:hypothetical protein